MIERERTSIDLSTVKNGDILALKITDQIYFLRITEAALYSRYTICQIYGGPFCDREWKSYHMGSAIFVCSSSKEGELLFDKIEPGKSLCIIMDGGSTFITDTVDECKLLE